MCVLSDVRRPACQNAGMSQIKDQLKEDLTTAMKSRDELAAATLRMALTAITNEEVAGKEARALSDDDVIAVLGREAKKRRESAEAYDTADRPELAERERAELGVLASYLPQAMTDEELAVIVAAAVAEVSLTGATGGAAMGTVMKLVTPQVKGRADGAQVAALVKAGLGM